MASAWPTVLAHLPRETMIGFHQLFTPSSVSMFAYALHETCTRRNGFPNGKLIQVKSALHKVTTGIGSCSIFSITKLAKSRRTQHSSLIRNSISINHSAAVKFNRADLMQLGMLRRYADRWNRGVVEPNEAAPEPLPTAPPALPVE